MLRRSFFFRQMNLGKPPSQEATDRFRKAAVKVNEAASKAKTNFASELPTSSASHPAATASAATASAATTASTATSSTMPDLESSSSSASSKNLERAYDKTKIPEKSSVTDSEKEFEKGKQKEFWEYTPTPEHVSLVLLLYRSTLKELLKLPSVRKRSFITYVRLTYRRRAKATEKLLIDECIEEARRGIYICAKHNAMKETGEYTFDDMFLPKDTQQDVKTFMEDVYDPVMAKSQVDSASDVEPGKEPGAGTSLRGSQYQRNRQSREQMKEQLERPAIREADMRLRPPPPPNG